MAGLTCASFLPAQTAQSQRARLRVVSSVNVLRFANGRGQRPPRLRHTEVQQFFLPGKQPQLDFLRGRKKKRPPSAKTRAGALRLYLYNSTIDSPSLKA